MATWRYIAQRALTGEFLDMEVPLKRDELTWALSGAGALRGTVAPDVGRMRAADGRLLLEEWGTFLYAEADGEIRWGGIVVSSTFENESWTIEAAGFSTYPHGMAWDEVITEVGITAFAVVNQLWLRLQSKPDGNLGVSLVFNGSPPANLGTAAYTQPAEEGGTPTEVAARPYELLGLNTPDVGSEIDTLARQTPFDYVESHTWNGNSIRHVIEVSYPRTGRRRDDLSFVEGSNITKVVTPTIDGDSFANEVIGLGAGEGWAAVRSTIVERDGRLRRTAVYTDKSVTDPARMDALVRDELAARRNVLTISSITVREHVNAPIGSWALGDDIEVDADIPWLGRVTLWCRVVGWSLVSEDTAVIQLVRSDTAVYGG